MTVAPPLVSGPPAAPAARHAPEAARIGPNAIIRIAEALSAQFGSETAARVFADAGLGDYLVAMPTTMVDEHEVTRLHVALRANLPAADVRSVSREAGRLTGNYLLANRIPGPAQRVLRLLPAPLAARALLKAIERNRWTFCGSAELTVRPGSPVRLELRDCALARGARSPAPVCDYYAATFERLFRELVNRKAQAAETACAGCGSAACAFEIRW